MNNAAMDIAKINGQYGPDSGTLTMLIRQSRYRQLPPDLNKMIHKPYRLFFLPKQHLVAALLALGVLQLWAIPSCAGEENPLKPIDTSSPRATLQGFIEFTSKAYGEGFGFLNTYIDSSALYLTAEELASLKEVRHFQKSAERALDLSELPPVTVDETARRRNGATEGGVGSY